MSMPIVAFSSVGALGFHHDLMLYYVVVEPGNGYCKGVSCKREARPGQSLRGARVVRITVAKCELYRDRTTVLGC